MAEETLTKLQMAERQLETAIGLFVSNRDRLSAISLAGAADGILHGLVLKSGNTPFSDYALGVREALSGQTPARAKFARHINDQLNINQLKHMDGADDEVVQLDVSISALGAILKAIANHTILVPEHPDFVKAMLHWAWMYYDGERILEEGDPGVPAGKRIQEQYEQRPEKIRQMETRRAKRDGKRED